MSEVYSIFFSAVFFSFIVTTSIIAVIGTVYYLMYKCCASYISFEKIANAEHQKSASKLTVLN